MNEHHNGRSRDEMESAVIRQLMFWAVICLVGAYLLGWPVILAWFGIAWGLRFFLALVFGESTPRNGSQMHTGPHRCSR